MSYRLISNFFILRITNILLFQNLPFCIIGYTKTLYTTDSSSLLSTATDKNTVSITPTQSTSRNASSTFKNSFLASSSHNSRRRYHPEAPRRYHDIGDFSRTTKTDNFRAYFSSPASSPTRANSGISISNESLSSVPHQCTDKTPQQLINISPLPSNSSSSWQTLNGVSGML